MSNNAAPAKKGVSAVDFFCIGFGAIVGVGWAVSINGWMTGSGGPVPAGIGYIVALIMMIPISLCYCELVPMLPVAGGGMAFALKAFNDKIAAISGWAAFGAFVAIIPWEAIQITDILGYLFPALISGDPLYEVMGSGIYPSHLIIGTICSILLFAVNMRGLASAAIVQKILCFVLVGCAIIGAVASIIGGSAENWYPIYDVTNPAIYGPGLKEVTHSSMFGGIMAILATAPFFLTGFEAIPQGVEEAGGDISSVGKTVMISVIVACLFYAMLLFCFGYAWPWAEFAGMARPAAATMFLYLFPGTAGTVLYWLLTLGAMAGLLTSWNGFYIAGANILMAMSRGRLMPAVFARQNKNDAPSAALTLCLVLSLIGPFLGANMIDSLTCFTSVGCVLSWTLTSWSLVVLRKRFPDFERPYKIPGGIGMGLFASIVSTIVLVLLFIPSSPCYAGKLSIQMFVAWMVVGIILYAASFGQRKGMTLQDIQDNVFAPMQEK